MLMTISSFLHCLCFDALEKSSVSRHHVCIVLVSHEEMHRCRDFIARDDDERIKCEIDERKCVSATFLGVLCVDYFYF